MSMRGRSESELIRDLGPCRLLGIVRHDEHLAVCAALDRGLAVNRVVKVLFPGKVPGRVVRRFVRDGRALAALKHAGLVATLECRRLSSGAAFVVTEPVEGEPADQWLCRVGNLRHQPALAAVMIATVADACAALGRSGVVHGDLRPGNVRLIPDRQAPARFTLKLAGSEEAAVRCWRASASGPVGSPVPAAHRAPELRRSGAAPDARSDIYTLGGLFLALLTGQLIAAHREELPSDPGVLIPGLAVEFQRLIGRMLARSPEQRYQSMDEIVTAVELILGRHRSRWGELLRAPEECPVRQSAPTEEISPDLSALAPALIGDPAERLITGTIAAVRTLGTAAREALVRRQPVIVAPTVLVAEDDDDTRESLVELLEEHGYRVISARHGLEAQDYLRKGEGAQCMVMDLWMPEMDGWTLAAEMREGRLPSVPTIVVTAAEPYLGYPSPIVVRKPFDARRLLGLVRAMSASDGPA